MTVVWLPREPFDFRGELEVGEILDGLNEAEGLSACRVDELCLCRSRESFTASSAVRRRRSLGSTAELTVELARLLELLLFLPSLI